MPPIQQNLNEAAFEKFIVKFLVDTNGYERRDFSRGMYDVGLALDTGLLKRFLEDTQSDKVQILHDLRGESMWDELFSRLDTEITKRGIIDCIRKGFSHGNVDFDLMYFKPRSGLNPEVLDLYNKNIFSVMRQMEFNSDTKQSLDVVLFLNGLPIFTVELKNELTGQTVQNAMRQYRNTRDPKLKIFNFKRCIAHFAVDTQEVFVTTRLAGEGTYFLPFNKGNKGGRGNPVVEDEHKSSYLWKEVWSKGGVSELLESFVHVIKEEYEDKNGEIQEREVQIFPRYQQMRAVQNMVSKCRQVPVGENYLIQHSAGSGKSMTIAMLAYQLSDLHDENNEKVFDTVFVLTDRRILNKQLGNTVKEFESTAGVLKTIITGTSQDLLQAIESGTKIISSTIFKFPIIVDAIGEQAGKKFALIIDEAHSSQSGSISQQVHIALGDIDKEDWIAEQKKGRVQPDNLSYFAFTATPKDQTLRLFGEKQEDGTYTPFDLYSMRQAIEEGFILDVLQNYITYNTFYKLVQKIPEDPMLDRGKTVSLVRRYVRVESIDKKVAIIATHFNEKIKNLIAGNAKAMIVTSSRDEAVRFKLAMDQYLKQEGYGYKTLVAFTDTIEVDGMSYTETEMNGFSESRTAKGFKKAENKFLIVADKYQTGFDEPLLSAMYVDKSLSGVSAVQTLSRLNRMKKGKEQVFVLDFVNKAEDIVEAFKPYYESTVLSEDFDVNALSDLKRKILEIYHFNNSDVEEFIDILNSGGDGETHPQANALLDKVVEDILRLRNKMDDEEEDEYEKLRANMRKYVTHYPFLSRVVGYQNDGDEKLFWFLKYILKKFPKEKGGKMIDITKFVEFKNAPRVVRLKGTKTSLVADGPIDPKNIEPTEEIVEDPEDYLSNIIKSLNERYGTDFGEQQQETLKSIEDELWTDEDTMEVLKNAQRDGAKLVFSEKFNSKVDDQFGKDMKFWNKVTRDVGIKSDIQNEMFRYLKEKAQLVT